MNRGTDIKLEGLPSLAAFIARRTAEDTEDDDALLLLPSISTVDRHGYSRLKPKETRRVY